MTDTAGTRDNIKLLVELADLARKLADIGREIDAAMDGTLGVPFVADNVSLIIMCRLEIEGPLRPTDIVDFTGLTSGGVTKVVTRLENVGLVDRRYGVFPEDRRGVSVELTDAGHVFACAYGNALGDRVAALPELTAKIRRLLGNS